MSLKESGYDGLALEKLSSVAVEVGDLVEIINADKHYVGILMPHAQVKSDHNHVVIKLENGYNVGIRLTTKSQITCVRKQSPVQHGTPTDTPAEIQPNLPKVCILSTGGTIASRIDYLTGAVNPALTAQELHNAVPELSEYVNLDAKVLMSKLSEDITPSDWMQIAKSVASEIKRGTEGIVLTHGTDTIGYTAAALSFALQDLPIPVVLVGSQRSSDRPSSDAHMNLTAAALLASRADAAEVMVAMHGTTDDKYVLAHRGTRVRKCHTSRRDAFKSINSSPLYRVEGTTITELAPPLIRRDTSRHLKLKPSFDDRVLLVKTYPGIKNQIIENALSTGYRGIVIEGSGLGHTPTSLISSLKSAIDADIVVIMTTQCVWGRVNMNVYRTGVKLLEIGVLPCENMLSETAVVKLMWLLANEHDVQNVKKQMLVPLVGEMDMRTGIQM